jgi:hypothetical protein
MIAAAAFAAMRGCTIYRRSLMRQQQQCITRGSQRLYHRGTVCRNTGCVCVGLLQRSHAPALVLLSSMAACCAIFAGIASSSGLLACVRPQQRCCVAPLVVTDVTHTAQASKHTSSHACTMHRDARLPHRHMSLFWRHVWRLPPGAVGGKGWGRGLWSSGLSGTACVTARLSMEVPRCSSLSTHNVRGRPERGGSGGQAWCSKQGRWLGVHH